MKSLSRRRFLQASAAAVAAPTIIPSRAFGANERIQFGFIGVRNQGKNNLKKFMNKDIDVVGLCDVDTDVLAEAVKLAKEKTGKEPAAFGDYRQLLEESTVDAVVVTTPDHWHALPTIHACQSGKDVYCEKPLSLTIAEGRAMVQAARENNRIVQTGSQQRSAANFRKACEHVRSGHIGELQQVLVGIPGPNHPGDPGPMSEPPPNLNYDFWLGPAPYRPYCEKRVHYNFRFWWDYSGGQMTNWGAHHIDIAQWGMGTDDTGPIQVEGTATFHPKNFHEVTETCRLTHTYANGVKLLVGQEQSDVPVGTTFIGTEGKIYVNRGKLSADPPEILEREIGPDEVHLYVSKDHYQNFLDSVRSSDLPICDVEIGHRSATVCHLSNIVARLGRSIRWDPKAERVIDDPEAQDMVARPYRKPWADYMPLARR